MRNPGFELETWPRGVLPAVKLVDGTNPRGRVSPAAGLGGAPPDPPEKGTNLDRGLPRQRVVRFEGTAEVRRALKKKESSHA